MTTFNNCCLPQSLNLGLLGCCAYIWPQEVSKGSQYVFIWFNGQFYHLTSRCHYPIISTRLEHTDNIQSEHLRCDYVVLYLSGYISLPNTIYFVASYSCCQCFYDRISENCVHTLIILAAVPARHQQMSLFNNWRLSWHFSYRIWFVRVFCIKTVLISIKIF